MGRRGGGVGILLAEDIRFIRVATRRPEIIQTASPETLAMFARRAPGAHQAPAANLLARASLLAAPSSASVLKFPWNTLLPDEFAAFARGTLADDTLYTTEEYRVPS
jgi:hypothetical protein